MRRLFGFVAAAALTGGALLALPSVSAAAATCAGTDVAVDFGTWGGPVVAGCDTGSPSNGLTLLTDEGFVVDQVTTQPGAVCRLGNGAFGGGTPYPTDIGCRTMPSSTAYWAYWLAAPGANSWSYSDYGPTNRTPVVGGVELWIFGGNISPSCTPNSVRAGSASTCTPGSSGSSGSGSGGSGSGSGSSGSGSGAGGSGVSGTGASTDSGKSGSGSTNSRRSVSTSPPTQGATAAPSSHAAATAASGSAGRTSSVPSAPGASAETSGSEAPRVVQAVPASKNTSAGSVIPLVVGLGIVVALGAGGGVAVWRRRRTVE